ncbi:hypothetical protein [Glaciecola sp. MF2-115]|uniref:hypothetical protein n=1 Tax=Glaciecola sp. MF2-115 TaxID=3384827 RepID=UPI0039A0DE2C
MDIIKNNWEWLSVNPWVAIALALMFFGLGWAAANLFYKERIQLLKEKNNASNSQTVVHENFEYPQSGRYGKNVLSNTAQSIGINEKVGFRAEIPKKSRILVVLKGPKPLHKSDKGHSWQYNLSKRSNWTTSTYESESGGRQEFTAENGTADMELEFVRSGEATIEVFEGEDKSVSWVKIITIRE